MDQNNSSILKWGIVPVKPTKSQHEGAGMAISLIALLVGFYIKNPTYAYWAIPFLLITMTLPIIWYPVTILWFSLSNILGMIMPKVLLTLIYLIILLPMALIRRWSGSDALLLRSWKKSNDSVFKTRNFTYSPPDLEKPY